jgi:tRNA A-37 threonylcarbamoyl transferase component Bud32
MNSDAFRRIVCLTKKDAQKQNPEELLSKIKAAAESPTDVIKEISKHGEIKRTLRVNIAPWGDLCLHEYRWNLKRVALSPFRLSRAKRTWEYSDEMISNQISVPEPILFLEVKILIFAVKTYLATRWIKGACSLHHLALGKDRSHPFDHQTILSKCVDTLLQLHKAGFIHGDLKWSNLLYVQNRNFDIVITDLDALKKTPSPWSQGRDFARFLIAPEKYPMKEETIELLIERYLEATGPSRSTMEKAIRGYLSQKTRTAQR